jgi:hypothetical protein
MGNRRADRATGGLIVVEDGAVEDGQQEGWRSGEGLEGLGMGEKLGSVEDGATVVEDVAIGGLAIRQGAWYATSVEDGTTVMEDGATGWLPIRRGAWYGREATSVGSVEDGATVLGGLEGYRWLRGLVWASSYQRGGWMEGCRRGGQQWRGGQLRPPCI